MATPLPTYLDLSDGQAYSQPGSGTTPYGSWNGTSLNIVIPASGALLINGAPISASVTFPLASATDQSLQPSGVANNALLLHNNAGAVNGLKITGTATSAAAILSAVGGDTNVGLAITAKGTGVVAITGSGGLTVVGGIVGPILDQGGATYNAKAYGVKVDGVTDDAPALQTLATAIAAAGGGILFVPAGICILHSNVTIPLAVSLQGAGSDTNSSATTFKCTAAAAGLTFACSGGICSGFLIEGNGVATLPFNRNASLAQTTFIGVTVQNSAQDNVYLGQCQNDVFISLRVQNAARDNLYMDNGAGGTRFYAAEIDVPGRYNVHIDNLITGGPAPPNVDDVSFNHAIIEEVSTTAGVYVAGGATNISFTDCEFEGSGFSDALIHVASGQIYIHGGHLQGTQATDTGIKVDTGAGVTITGYPTLLGFLTGIDFTGSGGVALVGTIFWNSVTNRYNNLNTADTQMSMGMSNPIVFVREGTGNPIIQSNTFNGSGRYFGMTADGGMAWGDGSSYGHDTILARQSAARLVTAGSFEMDDSTNSFGTMLMVNGSNMQGGYFMRVYQQTSTYFGDALLFDMGNNSGTFVGGSLIHATLGGSTTLYKVDYLGNTTGTAANYTSPAATALTVAAAGTNYGLQVDESTASAVTGLLIKAGAAGGGLALSVINGNAAENLTINAKGAGTIAIAGTSTGGITLGQITTISKGTKSTVITSGALSTQLFVSTTGAQVLTTRDVFLYTPVTFTPTAGAAATCVVAISPDNTTYTTLSTNTVPLGTALDSVIMPVTLWLPAGWYAKFTTTNATLGTSTYW